MKRNYSAVALASVVLLCLSVVGCGGSSKHVVTVAVTPATATITLPGTQTFVATATYSDSSTADVSSSATWSSSSTAVATVAGPVATGVAAGATTIMATFMSKSGTAALTVNAAPVLQSIAVTPANPSVANPGTQQFTATGTYLNFDNSTSTKDITSQVTWASSKPLVATIAASGLATTVGPGSTTITASLGTVTPGSTTLTVTGATVAVAVVVCPVGPATCPTTPPTSTVAVGSTVAYQALELLSDGTQRALQNPSTLTWSSGTTATASIGKTSGIAIAVSAAPSPTVITGTEGALAPGTANLMVQAALPRFAFNADEGVTPGLLSEWSVVASSGAFTSVTTTAASNNLGQVIIHPSGHFFYGIDPNSNLVLYDINSTTGAVTADASNGPYPTQVNGGISYAAIDPTGSFLYLVNYAGNNSAGPGLYGFTINQSNGALTAIGSGPITAGLTSPSDVVIDNTGTFVYVIDSGNPSPGVPVVAGTVLAYQITPVTGVLTPLSTPTFGSFTQPFYGVIDPSNTHLYVADSGTNTITVFPITAGTGLLGTPGTPLTVPVVSGGAIYDLAIDPTGKYLYVDDNFNLDLYGIVISTGAPTPSSPYTVAGSSTWAPLGVTIDPTGTIVAVTVSPLDNVTPGTISLFTLNPANGTLTPNAANASVPAGVAPFYLSFYSALAGQ